jgi:hypothetical protein
MLTGVDHKISKQSFETVAGTKRMPTAQTKYRIYNFIGFQLAVFKIIDNNSALQSKKPIFVDRLNFPIYNTNLSHHALMSEYIMAFYPNSYLSHYLDSLHVLVLSRRIRSVISTSNIN